MSDFNPADPGPAATIPITLHFGGDIPAKGLDADEVAAVAEGMAKSVQFVSERSVDADRRYTLHLREVKPGSAIFQFLLEIAAIAQSVLPVLPPGGFSVREAGEVLSWAVKLLYQSALKLTRVGFPTRRGSASITQAPIRAMGGIG